MLAKERHLYIMARLKAKPLISISDLCREMNVSKSTVQRDLIYLEKNGKIARERGGASLAGYEKTISDITESNVQDKIGKNMEAKKEISKLASAEIIDGDLIFIDSGTTPLELVPYLYNKNIKIVTNSYILLSRLDKLDIDVYMLGGKYSKKHEIVFGPATIDQAAEYRFDKSFIGANGADTELGEVYTSEPEIGALKKAVIGRSRKSFLLIDDSKFSQTGLSTFGYFRQFDKIFTNEYPGKAKKYKNVATPGGHQAG